MGFIIGFIAAQMFLDWPWRLLVIIPLGALEVFEIMLWLRWRGVRSITGEESIVGARGIALTDCDPEGQVKVRGQIWKARASSRIEADVAVIVTGNEGLTLHVAPASLPHSAPA